MTLRVAINGYGRIGRNVLRAHYESGKRHDIEKLSGQTKYPVIEFEDGSVYREESKDMAETIMAGKLFEQQGAQQAAS